MRPRTELLLVVTTVSVLGVGAALLADQSKRISTDLRPSTLLSGPGGASAFFDASRALGITTRRFRERSTRLVPPDTGRRTLLAILGPTAPLTGPERAAVEGYRARGDLLIAGMTATDLMRCYGYVVTPHLFDVQTVREAPIRVTALLQPTGEKVAIDSTRRFDTGTRRCEVPTYASVTPLLTSPKGVAAVRLVPADSSGAIVLVADVALFQNRELRRRESGAGSFVLGLVAGRYDELVVDEYHHGFGASGSLFDAVIAWSGRSPWGWAVWHLALVGLLALLIGAFRFGPIMARVDRPRRNPLEHLRALATALSAARGHDEAIGAIVRGLRRRLSPGTQRPSGDWRRWLVEQDQTMSSVEGRRALGTLIQLSSPGQPAASVLQAANAAEELWQSMRT
jgi:hypothetical protein